MLVRFDQLWFHWLYYLQTRCYMYMYIVVGILIIGVVSAPCLKLVNSTCTGLVSFRLYYCFALFSHISRLGHWPKTSWHFSSAPSMECDMVINRKCIFTYTCVCIVILTCTYAYVVLHYVWTCNSHVHVWWLYDERVHRVTILFSVIPLV